VSHRNIKYLNDNRVIYNRDPINDKPTHVYNWGKYYENGTYECYQLFKSKAKINSFKSLKWHLLVLRYLNPDMNKTKFKKIAEYITDKRNNFITFDIKEKFLLDMLNNLDVVFDRPPNNRIRKVIFKQSTGLSTIEKLKIVGRLVGRSKSINQQDIYQCMLDLNFLGKKITWSAVSKLLNVSKRTIYRNVCNKLKLEKHKLNEEI